MQYHPFTGGDKKKRDAPLTKHPLYLRNPSIKVTLILFQVSYGRVINKRSVINASPALITTL